MRPSRIAALYRRHFRDHRRERMFMASLSFFLTFGATRLLVHGFRDHETPFRMWIAGIHVHHYVWGIALLLAVGYLWLIQIGTGSREEQRRLGSLTAVLYGAGAALTLDEFALWLHLEDVYWEQTGRLSIDVALLFGALVSVGLWGGPFLRAVLRQGARLLRLRSREVIEVLATEPVSEPAPAEVPVATGERAPGLPD
jgi:hypothetical protein